MEYAILEKTVSCSEKQLALKMMDSTCSYLCLKVTYFAFEDVGCIEVMGCVKKLSQTVPAGRDLEYRTGNPMESTIPRVSGEYRVPIPYSQYDVAQVFDYCPQKKQDPDLGFQDPMHR